MEEINKITLQGDLELSANSNIIHIPAYQRELITYDKLFFIFSTLGNGNVEKGVQFLSELAENTEKARQKHSAEEWKSEAALCLDWLRDEVEELDYELHLADVVRFKEESLDVITVTLRIYNEEWK